MDEVREFKELIRRVRAGDQQAAADLVRRFEPAVRLEIHVRLQDADLRRSFDSLDVSQSVFGSFFFRAAAGQYELHRPEQLLQLLATMARNKLVDWVRKERSQVRDSQRRAPAEALAWGAVASPADDPARVAAGRELLSAFHERLTPEERQLADLRTEGCQWTAIAGKLGGSPGGRRMQLSRAVERVLRQLGLGG